MNLLVVAETVLVPIIYVDILEFPIDLVEKCSVLAISLIGYTEFNSAEAGRIFGTHLNDVIQFVIHVRMLRVEFGECLKQNVIGQLVPFALSTGEVHDKYR